MCISGEGMLLVIPCFPVCSQSVRSRSAIPCLTPPTRLIPPNQNPLTGVPEAVNTDSGLLLTSDRLIF